MLSTFASGDPFRSTLTIQNGAAVDDLQARYTPDAVGRVSSIDWRVQAADPWSALASYAHEGAAIRRRSTTQALGLGGVGTPFTFATTYGYDAYGRMATIDHGFDPAASVGFVYDAASNLTKELYQKQIGNRVGDRFGYDEHHRLRDAWLGSDAAHMAAPSGADPVGSFVQKLTYGLDAANNRSTVAAQAGPSGSTSTSTYTRQAGSNRYQSVAGVAMAYDDRGNTHFDGRFFYVYDGLNRLTEVYALGTEDSAATGGGATGASTSASSSSMTFTVSDVSALEHARGQILNRLAPDAHDLLDRATCPVLKPKCKQALSPLAVAASPTGSSSSGAGSGASTSSTGGTTETATLELKALYLYDPMNRRVVRWVLGEATHYYAYDGWQEVQEHAPGAAVEMTQFVWGEQLDELVAFRTSPGVGVWSNYYVAEGGAHCPSRVLNEAGGVVEVQEYDPYGATTYYSGGVGYGRSQVGNPFGWKAVRVDAETGLLYMRNRYYHVGWGRFLSIDPLGAWVDSATLGNAYAYGGNRPLVETDHYGLQVGHHVIPVSVFNDASLNLSPAAKGVFEAATTGAPSGGLPRDVHAWGHAHKRYNEAVMGEFRKLQEAGADLSKWSDKDAQRFVDRILDSADPRISRFLHQIDSWLDAAAAKGVSIKNRGIRSLPSLSWYRRCGRWLGEFGKLGKFVTIPLAVIGFSDDANAYGYSVATLNALNPIPFVDVQDILGLEPSLPPIDPPITEVLPASFIGPLAPWQARAM